MSKLSYGILLYFSGILMFGLDFLGFFGFASLGMMSLPILGATPILLVVAVGSLFLGLLLILLGAKESLRAGRGSVKQICDYCGKPILGRPKHCKKCKKKFCGEKCALDHWKEIHHDKGVLEL